MDSGYPTYKACTDEDLKAAAREILDALECLLHLMGEDAENPQQVRAYVDEAKKVLAIMHTRLAQDALPRHYRIQ